jgi:hypothetical protein
MAVTSTKQRYYILLQNAAGIPAPPAHRPLDWGTVVRALLNGVSPSTLYTTPAIWKQVRFTLKQQYGLALSDQGILSKIAYPPLMESSWIYGLDWDPFTKEASTRFGFHAYTFHRVPKSVFDRWYVGMASCTTDDDSGLMRWSKGDTPSLGAFFNQHINGRYPYDRVY